LRLLVTNHVWQQQAGGALGDKATLNNRDLCQATLVAHDMIPVARRRRLAGGASDQKHRIMGKKASEKLVTSWRTAESATKVS